MMSYFVAIGLRFAGDEERFWERVARIAQYLGSLPYREELRTVYSGVAMFEFLRNKDIEGGRRWLAALEQHGRRHHDRRALCEVLVGRAIIQLRSGSCQSALDYDARALHECMQIGDVPNGVQAYEMLCAHNLALGKLDEAEAWARRSLEDWMGGNDPTRVPWSLITQSVVRLCRRDYPGASAVIQEIGELIPRVGPYRQFLMSCTLAGIKLALGLRTEARAEYATIFRSMRPALVCSWSQRAWLRPHLPALLHGLAEAYGDSKAFWAFCRDYQTRHPDVATRSLQQWHLEPAMTEPVQRVARLARDFGWETVEGLRADGWRWSDPCGDSSFELQPAIGLVMCAGNGRELFFTNQSAPRLLGPMSGDFEAEVVCLAVDDRPAIGGLLLWRDGKNYVRVEWGRYGRREVLFEGCVANMDADYGCGCLPIETQRVFLRLARRGERVDALCSADGETWWSVGHAAFPVDDPVQIGLCAIGMIDRTIYPGAYREGTAIRFEAFRLW
jgi:regulation of enolase protein 1 (concanavalin A-like superfamily)